MSASCLHAARCICEGRPGVDAALTAQLEEPSQRLIHEIEAAGWPLERSLGQMVSAASQIENNRDLVIRVAELLRLPLNVDAVSLTRIVGAVADLEAAMRRLHPNLADDLAARSGPLMQQWQARGPGLLREVSRLTAPSIVPAFAEVVLVQPYVGGDGSADVRQNRVTLEAMLVNPLERLPEVLRLGWLLSHLNAELPPLSDLLPLYRGERALRYATIPAVLAAAAEVELAECDEATVDAAIHAWHLRDDAPPDAAQQIWRWWLTWLDGAAAWPVAVAALEAMLGVGSDE